MSIIKVSDNKVILMISSHQTKGNLKYSIATATDEDKIIAPTPNDKLHTTFTFSLVVSSGIDNVDLYIE